MGSKHLPPARGANQADVARRAGVSTQTVSRVISGKPNVRPETAKRVLAAVEELDYRVNHAASSLASGLSRILGLVVVSTNRYSFAAICVDGVKASAEHVTSVNTSVDV